MAKTLLAGMKQPWRNLFSAIQTATTCKQTLSVAPTVAFITGAALALVTSYFHDKNRIMFVLVLISHTVVALADSLELLALEDLFRVHVGSRVYFTPSVRLYSRLKRQSRV